MRLYTHTMLHCWEERCIAMLEMECVIPYPVTIYCNLFTGFQKRQHPASATPVERGFQWRKTWQFRSYHWMVMLHAKLNQHIIVDWWDRYNHFSGSLPEVAPDLFHTGVSLIHCKVVTIGLLKEFLSLSCYSCRACTLGINSAIVHLSVDYKAAAMP